MDKACSAMSQDSVASLEFAPRIVERHRQRSGASTGRLHRRTRMGGQFNTSIGGSCREKANLIAQGKEVKLFCVGSKGYEQIAVSSLFFFLEEHCDYVELSGVV